MNQYVFILAGGSGKRLWPLGRQKLPKQFIPFQDGKTLLDVTIERMVKVVPRERIWIITANEYFDIINSSVGHAIGRIVVEPKARNTGPAIFYALQQLHTIDPNASIIVTPADHVINDENVFLDDIKQASAYAKEHAALVLCGVLPTYAATQYGYIECAEHGPIAPVIQFHEKPTQEIAQQYILAGTFLWNTGIFCSPLKTLLHEYVQHTSACYDDLAAESIDYMILEKSRALKVIRASFDWSDVGTLDVFIAATKDAKQEVVTINAQNVVVHGAKKLVVVMGINDISVIETNDVLLIAHHTETEKIKNVVEYLKANGYEQFI